jgi:nucleoside-diphosphate-sugar epimerase
MINWSAKKTLVTGGASFIGSHLVDALVERGASIRVVDDLSSGKLENIKSHVNAGRVEFIQANLLEPGVAQRAVKGIDVVFHLAATHGGRGYIDLHQAACSTNLALDGLVFHACHQAGVEKVVFASSGCVYPNSLQMNPNEEIYLSEDLLKPPYESDNMYGWAKLMGELTLRAYAKDWGMQSACCRYFTAYGPREHENHAIMAMIGRSLIDQNPFIVWGDGQQIRNWTYVGDVVEATILAAEKICDGTGINIGTTERTRVNNAVKEILRYTGKEHLEIKLDPTKPTGPLNRVADNSLAKKLLGWEPKVKFIDGLHKSIDWYYQTKDKEEVRATIEGKLTER